MQQTSPLLDRSLSGQIRRGRRIYRFTTFLTVFAMLFGGLLLLSAPTVSAGANLAATNDSVNLRATASPDAEVITVLAAGTPLEITGDPENGFYPVLAEGNWGYVAAQYISWGDDAATGGSQGEGEWAEDPAAAEGEGEWVDDPAATEGEGEWTEDPAAAEEEVPAESDPAAASTWGEGGQTLHVIDGALNLRAGPTTSDAILTVMPHGASVVTTGEQSNGFLGITYNGLTGYAYSEFLHDRVDYNENGAPAEEEVPAPEETDTGGDPVQVGDTPIGSGVVADGPLNLRAGPSTSHDILLVMPHGAALEIMGEVQSGFHPVRYNGTKGWASAEFVGVDGVTKPVPGDEVEQPDDDVTEPDDGSVAVPGGDPTGTAMVIDGALNLRSGPGTNFSVLTVMPDSAEVSLLGEQQNGFYPVRFNGQDGWAFGEYLSIGGTTPDPDPGTDDGDDSGTDPEPTEPAPTEPAPTDPGNGDSNGDGQWSRDELVAIINDAAAEYGQPAEDMIRVAACESVWDPNAVNSSSGASGLFQFMPGTWLSTPYADQSIFDPVANARAAAWMWSVGRRNEWTCQ
jgi:uncharacterized protein YraI